MVMVVQTLRRPDNVKMDRVMVAIAAIGSERNYYSILILPLCH